MLTKDYEILEEIDRGRFGVVSKCKSLKTHEFFAVKSVDKSTLSGDELDKQSLINEPKALKMVASSSYVTRLHTTYDTPTHLHLILDYFPHPSLHSLRLPLPEPDTRPVMFSLLHALLHCHLHGVVHRDIKPDNVLFDPSSLSLKLCDFGSCAFLQALDHLQHSNARATLTSDCDEQQHTDSDLLLVHLHQQQKQHSNARATLNSDRCQQQHNCWPTDSDHCQQKKQHSWHSNARATLTGVVGTPYYVAPEILRGEPYDEKVDVWSAGVVLYVLIAGFPPFYGESVEEVFDKVLRGNLRFPSWVFRNFSPSVKDLLRRMICKDVNSRFSVQQALRHPWFTANGGGHSVPMI